MDKEKVEHFSKIVKLLTVYKNCWDNGEVLKWVFEHNNKDGAVEKRDNGINVSYRIGYCTRDKIRTLGKGYFNMKLAELNEKYDFSFGLTIDDFVGISQECDYQIKSWD
ncbi:MAG: hypothetical protein CL489_10390 [Acidobacteria bacterium]|nr:hypothetical protein [Acidobacteriota bacterium]|tara:strand:+ start:17374 stop:17700 length:327 start_codon:yes stop_codon:yes gene_type:complete